ncbi:MAG TPA: MOSC domain-containing protein [Chromatiales bacterium]|nr:MOSC domain-containing protein [Kiloniellaceae bacterium]HIP52748.1 MOSC domain-containing protein [Chromatiales bacterium]
MPSLTLSGITIYPVKSLAGIELDEAVVGERGFLFDRHWMIVDPQGQFLTQREMPRMALIQPVLNENGLELYAEGQAPLYLPLEPDKPEPLDVQLWNDRCQAMACGTVADQWLGAVLGRPARLVYLPPEHVRRLDPEYARPADETGFADGFPFLLVSEASLADLNSRLEARLSMRRFRPNLVVKGCGPYAEDTWGRIRIGKIGFRVVKPCARCAITTVDPDTAERSKEPLTTLAGYRRRGNKVYFGQNLIQDTTGALTVDDPVEILEAGLPKPFDTPD